MPRAWENENFDTRYATTGDRMLIGDTHADTTRAPGSLLISGGGGGAEFWLRRAGGRLR